jgi:preprotein translocase subunit SecF
MENTPMFRLKLLKDDFHFDFMKYRLWGMGLSLLLMVATCALLMTRGLNFGVDFTGGTIIEIKNFEQKADLADMRADLSALGLKGFSIQTFGADDTFLIRMAEQDGGVDGQKAAIAKIKSALEDKAEIRRTEYVGPQVGQELVVAGLKALIFSIMGIMIYVWFRFEWQFGVGAAFATLHDILLTLGFFALTQREFDLATVAAVLTVAGYSINDTVVVYDRIREMLRKYKKMPIPALLDKALSQTLSRTVHTGLTTLLALLALWLFGGEVIRSFTDAMVIGVLVGTFSSLYVGTPILLYLNLRAVKPTDEALEDQSAV